MANSSISLSISTRALPFLRMMVACASILAMKARKKKKYGLNTLIETQKWKLLLIIALVPSSLFSSSFFGIGSSSSFVEDETSKGSDVNWYLDRISLKLFWLIKNRRLGNFSNWWYYYRRGYSISFLEKRRRFYEAFRRKRTNARANGDCIRVE